MPTPGYHPLISVVIPTYNCSSFIIYTLDSVFAQKINDIEVIVVDDGSTDNTLEILSAYENRIIYIRQENSGVSQARNTGIKVARGKYIAFIDADDVWKNDKLLSQLEILESNDGIAGVFSDFALIDRDNNITTECAIKEHYPVFKTYRLDWPTIFQGHRCLLTRPTITSYCGDIFHVLYLGNLIKTSTLMLRKEILDHAGVFDANLRTQEDYDLFLKIASHYTFAYIDLPLSAIRRREGQLTSVSNNPEIIETSLNIIKRYETIARSRMNRRSVNRRLSDKYYVYGVSLLTLNKRIQAIAASLSSLKYDLLNRHAIVLMIASIVPYWAINEIRRLLSRTL